MTERVAIAADKIMNMWNSVSQNITEMLELGDIDRDEAKESLIELHNKIMFACEIFSTLTDEAQNLDIMIDRKFKETFNALNS